MYGATGARSERHVHEHGARAVVRAAIAEAAVPSVPRIK